MTEILNFIVNIMSTVILLIGFYVTFKKLPSEIKTTQAASEATDAKTDGVYIDNLQRLLDMFSKQSFDKITILTELGVVKAELVRITSEITRLTAENSQQREDLKIAGRRAEIAERALAEMSLRVDGFPAKIETLEAEIKSLNKAANEASESRAADAQTRKNAGEVELIKARSTENVAT